MPPSVFAPGGLLGQSVILSPESRPLECSEAESSCMQLPRHPRLVVIPSFVDSWRTSRFRLDNLPVKQRSVLACFIGRGVYSDYTVTESYRGFLKNLIGADGFYIAEKHFAYDEILRISVFCLVPKGNGSWSHRLYEALLAGCIPVVLSDDVELPFPNLPWEKFSVRWPMRKVHNVTLPNYLLYLEQSGHASVLKEGVDRYSCWLDYHIERADCSPFLGVMQQLDVTRQVGTSPGAHAQ